MPKETPESIRKGIEDKYLVPALDHEEDRADKCGKLWDFDWLEEGFSFLEPSLPRSAIMPVWEPPFRRATHHSSSNQSAVDNFLEWTPGFEEVSALIYILVLWQTAFTFSLQVFKFVFRLPSI